MGGKSPCALEFLEADPREAGAGPLAMNSNRGNYPAINGTQLKQMLLEDWHPPDRDALVRKVEERRAAARRGSPATRGVGSP